MSSDVVDLRSDTVTRPTASMRAAIADAEVGDDALGDDPTTIALERRIASLLRKEAALFFPSGIMANQAALMLLAPRGTEIITEATSHLVDWELGAAAAVSGVQLRPVPGDSGILDAEQVAAAIRPALHTQIRTSAVALENTHNGAGGRILSVERMRAVADVAREHGLTIHLDGARLWNASIATRTPERAWAELADTVMVTLSKGLGCPVGSVLAGTDELVQQARIVRRRLGGSMRQTGLLAAAGLYAIDHHRERLAEDHERAARLAQGLADVDGLHVVSPETNIVMIDVVRSEMDAETVVRRCGERGVLLTAFMRARVRAVTHLDVDHAGIEKAIDVIGTAVNG